MKLGDVATFQKTISESDVYQFAGITGDFNSLHINQVKAEKSIFGSRVAHGMLAASLVSTVLGMKMPGEGTIFMEQNCKFLAPIYINDTIEVVVTCTEIINSEKCIVKLDNTITNQDGKIVIKGYSVVKVPKNVMEEE